MPTLMRKVINFKQATVIFIKYNAVYTSLYSYSRCHLGRHELRNLENTDGYIPLFTFANV